MKKILRAALIILFFLFILLLIFFGYLTYLDSKQDNKSYRAGVIYSLGLSKISFLRESVSPKLKTLPSWEMTHLYWYPLDQETLKPDKGYICAIIGKLKTQVKLSTLARYWEVETKDKQVIRLNSPNNALFYLRLPEYNEINEQWEEKLKLTKFNLFENGDIILVEWRCPVKDPNEILDKNKKIKQEYLKVKPLTISKRK